MKLPRVIAKQTIRVLEKLGFSFTRRTGSHKIYKSAGDQRATVPYHSGAILKPKVLKNIIADAGITVEEFAELLKE